MEGTESSKTITHYFPELHSLNAKCQSVDDPVTGSSLLLTPDNTPTKEPKSHRENNSIPPLLDLNNSPESDAKSRSKASLSRSHSDSQLDSPKPTKSKLTKAVSRTNDTTEELPPKPIRGKGRKGRSRNVTKSKTAVKDSSAQSSKPATKSSEGSRSRSVPGSRNSTDSRTTLVTDYFPIRRSSRVPSKDLKKQKQIALEEAILSGSADGLEVVDIEGKGRGVVSTKKFKRGDFVVEYDGDLTDLSTAKQRESRYSADSDLGCYMYYFSYNNKSYCVDATKETNKLGRLLNHSKLNGNCATKVVGINSRPYLILVASRDIDTREELLYDYGDRNKETIEAHPWLAL